MGFFAAALPLLAAAGVSAASNLIGGRKDRKAIKRANAANMNQQREFAQMGVRWRVADAQAAGLSPLAAMGVSIPGPSFSVMPESRGDEVRGMGQDISRAIQAGLSGPEREEFKLRRERMLMENQLLKHQLDQVQNPVPLPSTVVNPVQLNAAEVRNPWQEAGMYPSVTYMRSPTGLVPIMPPLLAEAMESDQTNTAQWTLRYKGGPNVFPSEGPDPGKAKAFGADKVGFVWDAARQEWRAMSRRQLEDRGRRMAEARFSSDLKGSSMERRMFGRPRPVKGFWRGIKRQFGGE